MSWKKKRTPQQITMEKVMIEHTISKYNQPAVNITAITTYSKHNGLQKWDKARCLAYIAQLRLRGFIPGTHLTTKWGLMGLMAEFPTIPEEGLEFYGKATPDIIQIHSGYCQNTIEYNASEVHITTNQQNKGILC